VLETLKSDESLRTVPVVMLTSSREEQDLLRSYNLGVNGLRRQAGRFSGLRCGAARNRSCSGP
jgi:CheY-like chemotaxis protein